MNVLHAAILGIVEGITEFLPISSTAHLIIASRLLQLPQTDFLKTFEIAIQSGAIVAVLVFYWKSFLKWPVVQKVVAAFIPTAVIGFALYKLIKTFLLGNIYVVLGALLLGGIALIIFEKIYGEKDNDDIGEASHHHDVVPTYRQAVLLGIAQSLAVVPGTSRSATTIVAGRLMGLSKKAIVDFSFLLAVPTILAATALDIFKSRELLLASGAESVLIFIVGFIAAFISALVCIRFLLSYIRTHSFFTFGMYRILLVIVYIVFFL
jgi:undecaprenyl-diphosphatase